MNTIGNAYGQDGRFVSVVFADDSTPVRSLLRRCIAMLPGLRLVGVAPDGCEALEVISLQQPDLVLLDLHMPRLNGLQTMALVRELHPSIRIFLISVDDSEPVVSTCLAQGADAFVSKRRLWPDLRRALADVFPRTQSIANSLQGPNDRGFDRLLAGPMLSACAGQPTRISRWTIPVEGQDE